MDAKADSGCVLAKTSLHALLIHNSTYSAWSVLWELNKHGSQEWKNYTEMLLSRIVDKTAKKPLILFLGSKTKHRCYQKQLTQWCKGFSLQVQLSKQRNVVLLSGFLHTSDSNSIHPCTFCAHSFVKFLRKDKGFLFSCPRYCGTGLPCHKNNPINTIFITVMTPSWPVMKSYRWITPLWMKPNLLLLLTLGISSGDRITKDQL